MTFRICFDIECEMVFFLLLLLSGLANLFIERFQWNFSETNEIEKPFCKQQLMNVEHGEFQSDPPKSKSECLNYVNYSISVSDPIEKKKQSPSKMDNIFCIEI